MIILYHIQTNKSLNNIGKTLGAVGGLKEFVSLLKTLGGTSFSNMVGVSSVFSIFEKSGDAKEFSRVMGDVVSNITRFGKTSDAFNAIGESLQSISKESAFSVIGLLNLDEAQAKAILSAMGLTDAEIAEAAATLASGKAAGTASSGFGKLASSIGSSLKAVGAFLLTNPVGWAILATTAITAVTQAFEAQKQAMEEARQSALEHAESFGTTQDKFSDYVDEITKLKRRLGEYGISSSEVYEINKRLYEIQNELYDSYGKQASGIDLVNGKLETQLGLTNQLLASDARRFLTEEYSAIREAEQQITEKKTHNVYANGYDKNGVIKGLIDEKYSDYLTLSEMRNGALTIKFEGDTSEAKTVLNDFMEDVNDAEEKIGNKDLIESLSAGVGHVLSDVSEIESKYSEIYEKAREARVLADETVYKDYYGNLSTASKYLSDYEKALNEYNEALSTGDDTKIRSAKNFYESTGSNLHYLENTNEKFAKYADNIKEIESRLNTAAENMYNFRYAMSGILPYEEFDKIRQLGKWVKDFGVSRSEFLNGYLFDESNLNASSASIKLFVDEAKKLGYLSKDATTGELETFADVLQDLGIVAQDVIPGATKELDGLTGTLSDLDLIFNDDSDTGFSKQLTSYRENLDSLKAALESWNKGELTVSDMTKLQSQFSVLNNYDLSNFNVGIADAMKTVLGLIDETSTGFKNFKNNVIDTDKEVGIAVSNLSGITKEDFMDTFLTGATNKYSGAIKTLVDAAEQYGTVDSENMDSLERFCNNLAKVGIIQADVSEITEKSVGVMGLFEDAINKVGGEDTSAGQALIRLRENINSIYDATSEGITLDINAEISDVSNVFNSLKDSISSSGLTSDDVSKIKNLYGELKGYDAEKLFENTANGIHVNREEAEKLQQQYEELKRQNFTNELTRLSDEYEISRQRTEELAASTGDLTQAEINAQLASEGLRPTDAILDDISNVEMLISQFNGLTSAFNKWQQAKSGGNERDSFESVATGYKEMKAILDQGWYGDESLTKYLDLMLSASQRTGDAVTDWAKLGQVISGTSHSLKDYFSFENDKLVTDGLFNFLDDVRAKLGDSFVTINEQGQYSFDFTGEKLQQVANAFGTTTEFIQLMERALIDAGMTVEMNSSSFNELKKSLEGLQSQGKVSTEIDLNIDPALSSVEDVNNLIKALEEQKAKISVDTEKTEETKATLEVINSMIATLKEENIVKQIQLAITNGNTVDELLKLDDKELAAKLEIDDTQVDIAKEKLESLKGATESTVITVALDSEQFDTLTGSKKTVVVKYENDTTEPDNYEPKDKKATVKYEKDIAVPKNYIPDNKVALVRYRADISGLPVTFDTITRYVKYVGIGGNQYGLPSFADGTAIVNRVKGSAFARGDWGVKSGGIALGGELGEELLVRDGKYMTIGSNSAEFFKFKPGDIIFNAEQTSQLLNNGRITHGSKRGTSYASGTAFDTGTSGQRRASGTSHSPDATPSSGSKTSGSSGNTHYGSSHDYNNRDYNNGSYDKETPERFDWIEVAISRAERAINKFKSLADSVYKSFTSRNKNLAKEIQKVTEEIDLQQRAQERYNEEFDAVVREYNISDSLQEKIKNGTVDIKKYDAETQKAISEAKKFYDASLDCADSIDTLKNNLSELYSQRFELIITKWEKKLQNLQHTAERTQNLIDRRTTAASDYVAFRKSRTASSKNISSYKSLLENAKSQRAARQQEYDDLVSDLKTHKIKKGTEAYYDMRNKIQEVRTEIDTLNSSIIGYSNSIAEEYKNIFDSWSNQYESKLELISHAANEINTSLDVAEEQGRISLVKYYRELKDNEKKTISLLKEEYDKLNEAMKGAEVGSQAYYDMQTEINNVSEALSKSRLEVKRLNNEIRKSKWNIFDYAEERISRLTSEANFLVDLLDNKDLFTKKGKFTKRGKSVVGLHAVNYDVYMSQADDYAKQIKKINKQIAKDPLDSTLIERKETLVDAQQKVIESANSEKDAIVSLVKEGIDIEVSALKELVSNYKDALDSEADLSDYQKSVEEQTKNIATLQKQLNSYSGDVSEETRAKVQKIKVELEKAKESLEESEADRTISEQKKMLDSLANEYETVLNTRLDNVDALIAEMITTTNNNSTSISKAINSAAKEVGYTVSTEMKSIWANGGTSKDGVVATYGKDLSDKLTSTNDILNDIRVAVSDSATIITLGNVVKRNGTISLGNVVKRNGAISAHANGVYNSSRSEVAWINENGLEAVLSPSNRAIITHINKGDSVLNADATRNLFDMANNPDDYIKKVMQGDIVGQSNAGTTVNMGDSQFVVTLPNVKNYEEFKAAMQKDKKFEQFICSITVDPIIGKSKHQKNKFNF